MSTDRNVLRADLCRRSRSGARVFRPTRAALDVRDERWHDPLARSRDETDGEDGRQLVGMHTGDEAERQVCADPESDQQRAESTGGDAADAFESVNELAGRRVDVELPDTAQDRQQRTERA